jgi:L-threonylcarbamoyladenylate synthase
VFVDPDAPQRDAIEEAAKWILAGAVVALPTDTLYGLAVDPFNAAAVARLFAAKGRPEDRGIPLIAADRAQVEQHLGPLIGSAARVAERFWPGPLTLLLPAPRALAAGVSAGTGRVGVRVPADKCARAICAAVGRPITATSANVSGEPATADPSEVERTLGASVTFLFDTGRSRGGAPSTIVDLNTVPPTLVRAGAISWDEIQACLNSVHSG